MLTLFTRLDSKKSVKAYIDNLFEIVDLLNKQQATITAQKKGLDEYMDNIIALSKENEQLRQSVEYWQKKYEEGTETFQIN